jgi:hypothetical protein
MKTATMTEAQQRKLVNKISLVVTLVLATFAICYIVKAWLITAPYVFK